MFKILASALLLLFVSTNSFAESTATTIRKNAISLDHDDLVRIFPAVSKFKFVTVGEMHGSRETPRFVGDLFELFRAQKKTVILGLEVPQGDQPLIDKFIQSKDRSVLKASSFFVRSYQDGRSSEAMVALLENLPKDAVVVCFDSPTSSSGQERDKEMAENLIRAYQRYRPETFIILAGNVHSSIEIGNSFDPKYQPMSYLLHALPHSPIQINDIRAIRIRYAGGSIWACMGTSEADCKIQQLKSPPSAYGQAVSYGKYFLLESLGGGYNATLFFRSLTASPPAFK